MIKGREELYLFSVKSCLKEISQDAGADLKKTVQKIKDFADKMEDFHSSYNLVVTNKGLATEFVSDQA